MENFIGYEQAICKECDEWDYVSIMEQLPDGSLRHRDVRVCLKALKNKVLELIDQVKDLANNVETLSDKVWDRDHSYD